MVINCCVLLQSWGDSSNVTEDSKNGFDIDGGRLDTDNKSIVTYLTVCVFLVFYYLPVFSTPFGRTDSELLAHLISTHRITTASGNPVPDTDSDSLFQ